jgi:uncharacterized protein YjbJ (UPF0337 family)
MPSRRRCNCKTGIG